MAWIESHQSLLTHRKTLKAARLLGIDRYKLIGHLHALWWWALDNLPADGNLNGTTGETLAAVAGFREMRPGKFAESLLSAGFLDGNGLHNWYQYSGKLSESRDARRDSNRESQRRHRLRSADVSMTKNDSKGSTVPTVPNPPNPTNQTAPAPPPPAPARAMQLLLALHENRIGTLSKTACDQITDWEGRIPEGKDAADIVTFLGEEADKQDRIASWSFFEVILSRLEKQGWPFDDGSAPPPKAPRGHRVNKDALADDQIDYLEKRWQKKAGYALGICRGSGGEQGRGG